MDFSIGIIKDFEYSWHVMFVLPNSNRSDLAGFFIRQIKIYVIDNGQKMALTFAEEF
jgi:hypothetical protein